MMREEVKSFTTARKQRLKRALSEYRTNPNFSKRRYHTLESWFMDLASYMGDPYRSRRADVTAEDIQRWYCKEPHIFAELAKKLVSHRHLLSTSLIILNRLQQNNVITPQVPNVNSDGKIKDPIVGVSPSSSLPRSRRIPGNLFPLDTSTTESACLKKHPKNIQKISKLNDKAHKIITATHTYNAIKDKAKRNESEAIVVTGNAKDDKSLSISPSLTQPTTTTSETNASLKLNPVPQLAKLDQSMDQAVESTKTDFSVPSPDVNLHTVTGNTLLAGYAPNKKDAKNTLPDISSMTKQQLPFLETTSGLEMKPKQVTKSDLILNGAGPLLPVNEQPIEQLTKEPPPDGLLNDPLSPSTQKWFDDLLTEIELEKTSKQQQIQQTTCVHPSLPVIDFAVCNPNPKRLTVYKAGEVVPVKCSRIENDIRTELLNVARTFYHRYTDFKEQIQKSGTGEQPLYIDGSESRVQRAEAALISLRHELGEMDRIWRESRYH